MIGLLIYVHVEHTFLLLAGISKNKNSQSEHYIQNCSDWINLEYNCRVRVMVLNATFNNIAVISWQSVLLVEETGGPHEKHRPAKYECKCFIHVGY